MTKIIKIGILILLIPISIMAQKKEQLPESKVDYDSFLTISEEVQKYRTSRMVTIDEFLEYLKDEHTLLLDTRSEKAYTQKHIKAAVHLNFSDFTEEKLKKIIPSKNTRILIYCNNNIDGDTLHFASKMMPLALNIPTFINLYGYGYKNIYELGALVPSTDNRLIFSGTEVK
ncbi:rhodanese-like domain-containing protein [Aquimarina addita]|uniref:Rhodanese-like domain-containing protein n=1 Tax=Aquimarina addita TaxID=870485 RepID=A0ABP6UI08_9FLAO